MASRKKRNRAAGSSSPSTVLVIFLVFFILLSMGLGLWGYYGYQAAQKKEEAGKKIKADAEKDTLAADWYKLQALWAKGAAGHELQQIGNEVNEPADLATLLTEIDSKFANEKTKPAVAKMIEEDKKELEKIAKEEKQPALPQGGWDGKSQRFAVNYRTAWFKLKKKYDTLLAENKTLNEKLDTERKRQDTRDETEKTKWTGMKGDIDKLNKDALTAKAEALQKVQEANAAKVRAMDEKAAGLKLLQEEFEVVKKKYELQLKGKDDAIAKLKVQKGPAGANAEEKTAKTDLLEYDAPKGKVVRIDYTGQMPYINLGRADKVKEQLTFSIYSRRVGGKMAREAKGTVEVVRVIAPHLAQTRVTWMRDAVGDPLQEGDLIFNPAWNPDRPTHVAIAGLIDFTGGASGSDTDNARDLQQFVAALRRQNIVVDSYLDLHDQKIKGPGMTLKTDYFILGESPATENTTLVNAKGGKANYRLKVDTAMKTMRNEAARKGVTIIPLHKFALLTGYRIPRGARVAESDYAGRGLAEDREAPVKKKDAEDRPKMGGNKGGKKLGKEEEDEKKE